MKLALWCFCLFLAVYLLKYPENTADSVRNALNICAVRLIPSLFPFIILSNLICKTRLADSAAELIGRPFEFLFGLPKEGSAAFLLGAIGGFPVGAITTRALLEQNLIDRKSAARLVAISNNVGVAFCVGGIGSALYSSPKIGWLIWISQLSAAIFLGILTAKQRSSRSQIPRLNHELSASELLGVFADSVSKGGLTILQICSFAVFFSVIGELLIRWITALFGINAAAIAAAFCELTLASRICAPLGDFGMTVCCFASGFAGLSVFMQIAAILSGSGISIKYLMIFKSIQALLASLIFSLILYFFH